MPTETASIEEALFSGTILDNRTISNEWELAGKLLQSPPPRQWLDAVTWLRSQKEVDLGSLPFKSKNEKVVNKQKALIGLLLERRFLTYKLAMVAAAMLQEALEKPPK